MRMFRAVVAFTLLVSTVAAGSAAAPASAERATYIVVLDDAVTDVEATARSLAHGAGGDLGFVYQHALKGFSAKLSAQAASALARNPRVASISESRSMAVAEQSVPTGVSRIDAPVQGADGSSIRVAIIDTGIDLDHEDLPNVDTTTGKSCIEGASVDDDQGHGTHVAGTVGAADNAVGVVGVAPGVELVPVKVLNSSGSGTDAEVICGIDHLVELNTDTDSTNDVHVANMSLGGSGTVTGTCGDTEDAMYAAICRALAVGVTFVVAAGNSSADAATFLPAGYPEVITVSAYTDLDGTAEESGCTGGRGPFRTCDETFASFSNYGEVVDVIAPGVTINSTTIGGSYGTKSGTSMAAPHVAGVAALILAANSGFGPADVAAHLRTTGQCPNDLENPGSESCAGQWTNDGDGFTEPMAHAVFALGATSGEPTNEPPTASFTHSCTDLGCSFNGSASTDSDGSISSHAWTFGDGGTGAGVTASHLYVAGGAYTVTLTVTDDDGSTGSLSQSVTVTEPGGGTDQPATYAVSLTESTSSSGPNWIATVGIDVSPDGSIQYTWSNGASGSCSGDCVVSQTLHKRDSSITLTVTQVAGGSDFDGETQVTVFKA